MTSVGERLHIPALSWAHEPAAGRRTSDHEPDEITTLSDASFDEHVKVADIPVLVDFWAEWCGPCKMIAPVLEEIAGEHAGKVQVAKLNIDENLDVTRRFEVMSIPTLILFKDGEPEARIIGARGKAQLLQELSGLPVSRSAPVAARGGQGRAAMFLCSPSAAATSRGGGRFQFRLTTSVSRAPSTGGKFGDGTKAALEAFQHRRGLRIDGVCGLRPGRHWSRPAGASATVSSTAGRRCCGATTSPSCSNVSVLSGSTRLGSTDLRRPDLCRRWASSSATPGAGRRDPGRGHRP